MSAENLMTPSLFRRPVRSRILLKFRDKLKKCSVALAFLVCLKVGCTGSRDVTRVLTCSRLFEITKVSTRPFNQGQMLSWRGDQSTSIQDSLSFLRFLLSHRRVHLFHLYKSCRTGNLHSGELFIILHFKRLDQTSLWGRKKFSS